LRDVNSKLLGYVDKRGTFDQNRIKLFNSPVPELLLKCSKAVGRVTDIRYAVPVHVAEHNYTSL